ncbi:sigma E protease regulator RseP [Pseudoalteromonas aurantia]|uniref:Zinc metalloprotease n=1 Tax=Pseudoalteromonas aurantia TaxID=43654 RepID=A0A5S3VB02_9GAMM|nr:sigma E protease regulator RseP [Pseudoalteromonas aurantia]TMO66586.1 zinc metallopeptidase RseP [Pseudoalteromonas aurantia]TMO68952.1 zinc metallopeptidase RseP [Pseudoalteromonas aurantia]TMO71806.1 zinc metallopeptidase RseP [Pseudoalteromonas aurantia]
MFEFLWNLGSFIVALGILVTVHEYGHFWVARKCAVEVQRFSIGFGKPLLKWHDKLGTEYVIALIPLGGYVKMLDGRVDEVPEHKRHLAFNSKPVLSKIAVVAAGPIANFLFAIIVLAAMYMIGVQNVKPVVGGVTEQSRAETANFQAGDHILQLGDKSVSSWQEVTFGLMSNLGEEQVVVKVQDAQQQIRLRALPLNDWKLDKQDEAPLQSVGIQPFRPEITLTLAHVQAGSAAEKAGLQVGDTIRSIDSEPVQSWQLLVDKVKESAKQPLRIIVIRAQEEISLTVIPGANTLKSGETVGYLGVVPQLAEWPAGYIETRQYGPLDSMVLGIKKTYELISLSFDMIGNLITGQVSVKNLSGPVGIAVGAGNSVSYGIVAFLSFLALISVNLGVFNLLPLPVLDGGHLMYYLIELIRKKPVSEKTQELGFKVGALLLIALTCFALLNDVSRL